MMIVNKGVEIRIRSHVRERDIGAWMSDETRHEGLLAG